jgi:two-component system, oxyanion-binding sensor
MSLTPDHPIFELATPRIAAKKSVLRLGFMPLTDCAPLIVAEMLGLFRKHDVTVELSPLHAWVAVRDKISIGQLDGGQLLAPMPIAASLEQGGVSRDLAVVATLSCQGNSITLGDALLKDIHTLSPDLTEVRPLPATALAKAVRKRRAQNDPVVLAVVYPFSSHAYLLRYWLAAGGIDPEKDVILRTVPPPLIADELAEGRIDGFCAGPPWGSRAADLRAGRIALGTGDIWPHHPEKILAVSANVLRSSPEQVVGLVAAAVQAGQFLSDKANLRQAAKWVHYYALPQVPLAVVEQSLADRLPYGPDEAEREFAASEYAPALTCPHPEHGRWWLRQMQRWGHAPESVAPGLIERLWRPDIWHAGMNLAGFDQVSSIRVPCPMESI